MALSGLSLLLSVANLTESASVHPLGSPHDAPVGNPRRHSAWMEYRNDRKAHKMA